ncbi:MAG: hypothetical protein D8H95_37465 [Lachnospiraceae bacterium]|nr:MAG: hypothetical protein D8H95_37465 [Lachnospiraceae bacterium]
MTLLNIAKNLSFSSLICLCRVSKRLAILL